MSTFTAVVHKENDLYVAECPEVGTVSQGETIEEAVQNLQEAALPQLLSETGPGDTVLHKTLANPTDPVNSKKNQ
ncbi:MAG: type II toxin-antitoxin system HicB family antitoxin [Thermodesulfobacteriota bacterium]